MNSDLNRSFERVPKPALPSSTGGSRRHTAKKGLTFTMMVVGSSGLGKSTFINTLCESTLIEKRQYPQPDKTAQERTLSIQPHVVDLEEEGFKIQLTIIDTPGFGDNINNEKGFNEILRYIERQYDEVLAEESRIKRNTKFQDSRVHCLLYFIPPYGKGLKPLDIEFMKTIANRVNVIPVIAKSDSLSPEELLKLKSKIMSDIHSNEIPIFEFSYSDSDDEELIAESQELRSMLPFSVVGAQSEVLINGKKTRCREYPWGIVQVDNEKHCDFSRLRYCLLTSHLLDFKEITHDMLYELYRTERLSKEADVDPNELGAEYVIVPSSVLEAKPSILKLNDSKLKTPPSFQRDQ